MLSLCNPRNENRGILRVSHYSNQLKKSMCLLSSYDLFDTVLFFGDEIVNKMNFYTEMLIVIV